jgi:hypothetical protein
MGCDFTIGSHLGPVDPTYRRPHHILQLVMQITGLMARKNYLHSIELADFVVHTNLDKFSSFDFNSSEKTIEMGYTTTKEMIGDLRSEIKRKGRLWNRLFRKRRR